MFFRSKASFTLIELLIVIAVIAVLAVVVILVLNPVAILQQNRDSTRLSDMSTLNTAINLYSEDQGGALGTASTTYISIPDPAATSTAGTDCSSLGMPALPSGWVYHCAASSSYKRTDGTGWIPLNFNNASFGSPLGTLPVDPTNQSSTGLYYAYAASGSKYELTAVMESSKYILNGSNDKVSTDGGILPDTYELGNNLTLFTADRGREVAGEWLFDEGSGSVANDSSIYGSIGQLSGSPTWSSGKLGNALTFSGTTGQEVNLGSPTALDFSSQNAFTIAAWVYPQGTAADETIISRGAVNSSPDQEIFYLARYGTGSGLRWFMHVSEGSNIVSIITPDGTLDLNAWQQMILTWDGITLNIYKNGTLLASSTNGSFRGLWNGGSNPTNSYTAIGADAKAVDKNWNGIIDEVQIYKSALSAAQVLALYNAER